MSDTPHPALPQTFPVRPYRPDGGFSLGGALQLVGFLGLAGMILGGVASVISQFFYLIVLFPILIGLGVGWVGSLSIRRFKIRRPLTCGAAGFVAGGLAMLSMQYFDYQRFQTDLAQQVEGLEALRAVARNAETIKAAPEDLPAADREDILNFLKELEEDEEFRRILLVDSLWSFIDLQAFRGVELQRGGARGSILATGARTPTGGSKP